MLLRSRLPQHPTQLPFRFSLQALQIFLSFLFTFLVLGFPSLYLIVKL
nr:MAG TPA: hypothetical protein [Bacteriophage sp.]